MAEKELRARRTRLKSYAPYAKQEEFHAAGAEHRERLFQAANQAGKSTAGAAEAAIHLSGEYPDWWRDRCWSRPVHGWVASETSEVTRDGLQRILLGTPGDSEAFGTGMIPHAAIIEDPDMRRGVANAVDTVRVRHASGGVSTLGFKSYDQGRRKFQASTLDFVAFDEEPPIDIYMEGLTRTNHTQGVTWLTFTPLLGMSEVVRSFHEEAEQHSADE